MSQNKKPLTEDVSHNAEFTPFSRWTEGDIDFLMNNAGYVHVNNIAAALCKSTEVTREKMKSLGLNYLLKGMPKGMDDLEFIPEGTTIQSTPSGRIYRVPTSTPGIPTRTIHSSCSNADEIELEDEDDF